MREHGVADAHAGIRVQNRSPLNHEVAVENERGAVASAQRAVRDETRDLGVHGITCAQNDPDHAYVHNGEGMCAPEKMDQSARAAT